MGWKKKRNCWWPDRSCRKEKVTSAADESTKSACNSQKAQQKEVSSQQGKWYSFRSYPNCFRFERYRRDLLICCQLYENCLEIVHVCQKHAFRPDLRGWWCDMSLIFSQNSQIFSEFETCQKKVFRPDLRGWWSNMTLILSQNSAIFDKFRIFSQNSAIFSNPKFVKKRFSA